MTEALYTQSAYHIMYVASAEVQTMRPRMGTSVNEGTLNLSEMPIPLLEPGTGEEIMPPPKDPEKYALYIKRQSESRRGKKCPESVKERLRALYTGRTFSEETRAKIGAKHKGKTISLEQRARISAKLTGTKATEETRKKLSAMRRGKPHTEEWNKKISAAQKGKPRPKLSSDVEAERRRKISEGLQGCKRSEETRLKLSGENSHNWKGGISFEPYCEKFNQEFKERVREFYGRKCVECGTPENGRKLSIHHVNFDKSSCCSDVEPLFVALCTSCHMRTNHNRRHWEKRYTEMIMTQFGGECYLPKKAQNVEQIEKGGKST